MSIALEYIGSLDYVSLGTNAGVVVGFLAAAILGVKQGLKVWNKPDKATDNLKDKNAHFLIDTDALNKWGNSNASVIEAADDLRDSIEALNRELTQCTTRSIQSISDLGRDINELRHQIERLRDKML